MTDQSQPPAIDWQAFEMRERERARLASEALILNKTTLFDALATAGITSIIVAFDGCGDSGQIENVEAERGDATVGLPDASIAFAAPNADISGLGRFGRSIGDAIETMAYDLLADTHGGWGNDDGAYGTFAFDVATRTITLDFNARYTASENYSHEF